MKTFFVTALVILGTSMGAIAQQITAARPSASNFNQHSEFMSVGDHHTSGGVHLEVRPDGLYIVLDERFRTDEGPALVVTLRDSKNPSAMKMVAPLQSFTGMQEYKVDFAPDIL
jgi:hypothetical protein